MYKLAISDVTKQPTRIQRLSDNAFIPFDHDNTDYTNFKKEINEETAQLQDADGNTMTSSEAKAFVATLP